MTEYLDIKVTTIGNHHHARLLCVKEGMGYPVGVLDEMACVDKMDIGYICRQMLRWHDKGGGTSPMASASRHRKEHDLNHGKVYHRNLLHKLRKHAKVV